MKAIAAAVLLIAVSAWGQSPSLVGKPHTTKYGMPLCAPSYIYASNECPTYDPDTKEWISQKESSVRQWAKDHKPKHDINPYTDHIWQFDRTRAPDKTAVPYKYGDENHIDWTLPCNKGDASEEGGHVVDNKGCIHPEGWRAPVEAAVSDSQDHSDESLTWQIMYKCKLGEDFISCVNRQGYPSKAAVPARVDPKYSVLDHVWQNTPKPCPNDDEEGFCLYRPPYPYPDHIWQSIDAREPDKAAVPVEPCCGDDTQREQVQPINEPAAFAYAVLKCNPGIHSCDMKEAVQIHGIDSTVVKLADEEYFHLQHLRASVVEEEKRLAVKYGAATERCVVVMNTGTCPVGYITPADHYEYHGQFLLIDKGGK